MVFSQIVNFKDSAGILLLLYNRPGTGAKHLFMLK